LFYASPMLGEHRKPVSQRSDQIVRVVQGTEPEAPTTTNLPAQENQATTPRVLKFSGVLMDLAGKPLSGPTEVTFKLYRHEADEDALWAETQTLEVDKEGRYTVLLGATQAEGIPVELFSSAEAHWLGVEIQGQAQQPRTLLVSVPYALKAVEAEKLAGKSVSDFVLSESLTDQVRRVIEGQTIIANQATSTGTAQQGQPKANSTANPHAAPAGAGPMFPPSSFSGTNATQIVSVQQNGVGAGLVAFSPQNNALVGQSTAGTGFSNGVFGQSASPNGNGVFGNNTVTSGGGVGVFGQTPSPEGIGVVGINTASSGFARGVSGGSNSTSGVGVFGSNNATSGNAHGVFGLSNSPAGNGVVGASNANAGGNGVFGSAAATSGFANGVFGQSFSTSGTGVAGFANATSGFISGVSGDASASPNGTGVFGSSFQWVGVGGQATASSGGPAFGVWGDSVSTGGTGVAGFADATSGYTNGVSGQSVSPNGNGVIGVNNSTVGNFNNGVLGINNSTSGNAYGVSGKSVSTNGIGVFGVNNSNTGNFNYGVSGVNYATSGKAYGVAGQTNTTDFAGGIAGEAFATSGVAFGVFGQGASPNGFGLFGYESAPSGAPTAVFGMVESPSGIAGQFVDHSGSGLILQGLSGSNFNQVFSLDANGNLNISGNLTVSGTKSSTARLQDGQEIALYAVESPENWFEDFGSAELIKGVAWVPLDGRFAQAVNATVTYHVFLTPNGDSNGLYVARKTAAGFEIREHGGGTSNVAFDYRIVVRRRGYETVRMAEVPSTARTIEPSRQHLVELVNSGTLAETGVKMSPAVPPRIAPPSTIRPVPQRPIAPQLPRINIPQSPKVNVSQPPQTR
jgi:hypothetical protein